MSHSHRLSPYCGITTARSEKKEKRAMNRIWRRRVRVGLTMLERGVGDALEAENLPRRHCEIVNIWSMSKDGRYSFRGRQDVPKRNWRGYLHRDGNYLACPSHKLWGK